MFDEPDRTWSAGDVPAGPYLHGSRWLYRPGDLLPTDVVNNMEGEEDDRQMCYATTSLDQALDWAYSRGLGHAGRTLYVYEVEMLEPEVDVNTHRPGIDQEITSVMSPRGRVVGLVHEVAVDDYPRAFFGKRSPPPLSC